MVVINYRPVLIDGRYISLIVLGVVRMVLTLVKKERMEMILNTVSLMLGILCVLLLTQTRIVHACALSFLILPV